MNTYKDIDDMDYFVVVDGNKFYAQNGKSFEMTDTEYNYYMSQGLTDSEIKTLIYYQLDTIYPEMISDYPLIQH